jgi:23S rRNA (cytosine1962-C5)-methyltransferase
MSPRALTEHSTLELPASLESSLAEGHPWVYRDHVPRGFSAPNGGWVKIRAGRFTGYALWDEDSAIALRVFSAFGVPDAAWVAARVTSAWELRAALRDGGVTAFRCLSGEGDGLPGVTADFYAGFVVLVTYAGALEPIVPWVVTALSELPGVLGILRRDHGERASELELVWGRRPPHELVVQEHGVRLPVDLGAGQKTGLFLDQRENRRLVGELARGKSVLNLFSYTGGFSLHAALGGAARVASVDSAPGAMQAARRGFELNGLDPDAHEFVVDDAFAYLDRLAKEKQRFDLVISDPPSFARNRQQLAAAERAYSRLGTACMNVTQPGGFYVASSCTGQVSQESFKKLLAGAARTARKRFQIVHEAGQPLDHPVLAGHPEGRYLKFVVGRVLQNA